MAARRDSGIGTAYDGAPAEHVPTSRRRVVGRIIGVAALVAFIVAAPAVARLLDFGVRVGEGAAVESSVEGFYGSATPTPASTSATPGTIVRSEPVVGAPDGATALRVVYHSTDVDGADILVSGLIVAPSGPSAAGSRTVVSWAHPTTGTAPHCAPSSGVAPFALIEGLTDLLADGNVVVATDYAGMGIPGPASFLIGATEAANVLDIARAAQHVEGIDASDRVVLWGHSQGGHAALFAAQRAATYAPDLDVRGVAVAAPASDLAALLEDDIRDVSGVTIGTYAFNAYAEAYADRLPAEPLSTILSPAGVAAVPAMAKLCLLGENQQLHDIADPMIGSFLTEDPATAPVWSDLLRENTPTERITVPLFVAQGSKDTLIRPAVTAAYVAAQKQAGASVTSRVYPDADHATVALTALADLRVWMRTLG
ncbi:alpha/beta fold hydrolase [uncultured Plantibacter sp.]|uniref:alpha/beta fold hydrolase n=1 Tax=uncultured Plantibacter sp. TaxID=293337 RepID=UPI0028D51E84|nr:alpha/beta fold hydrolase [uncultured Plantibacter sp.]